MAFATIYYTSNILVLVTILCMNSSIEFLCLKYFTYICNQKSFFSIPMYYMIPYQSPNRHYKIFKKWKYQEVFSGVLQQLNLRVFSLLYFPFIIFPIYTVYKQNLLVIWKTVLEKFKKALDISDMVCYIRIALPIYSLFSVLSWVCYPISTEN